MYCQFRDFAESSIERKIKNKPRKDTAVVLFDLMDFARDEAKNFMVPSYVCVQKKGQVHFWLIHVL